MKLLPSFPLSPLVGDESVDFDFAANFIGLCSIDSLAERGACSVKCCVFTFVDIFWCILVLIKLMGFVRGEWKHKTIFKMADLVSRPSGVAVLWELRAQI